MLQPELFNDQGAIVIDTTFARASRTELDPHSWIEVVPGWITGADSLFDLLRTTVPWKQHHRTVFEQTFLEPRMSGEYKTMSEVTQQPLVDAVAALSAHYRVPYDSLWLNFYRDGRDSTGFHRDRFSCRKPLCIVPVLTLGATRRFLMKPRYGGASIAFTPRSGDLIVMGGRSQEDWVHGVPKSPDTLAGRISVNFQSSVQARRSR